MHIRTALIVSALVSCVCFVAPCRANYVYSVASCNQDGSITFTWHFVQEPNDPAGPAEWTGWDVMRRRVGDESCEAWARLTEQPLPRILGSHDYSYTETSLSQETLYEYEAVPVDNNRQRVVISPCWPCTGFTWASCPNQSAPLTKGTLTNLGWALYVQACAGSCYQSLYFEGPAVEELRQYAGTGTIVELYGVPQCGTVEGCSMQVEHYEFGSCGAVPIRTESWSGLKTRFGE